MEILTANKPANNKVIYLLILDCAEGDDGNRECLIFRCLDKAVSEFDAQLAKLKSEYKEILEKASNELSCDEEGSAEFLYGEYDYSMSSKVGIDCCGSGTLVKSFVLYSNENPNIEHVYLILSALNVIE